MKFDLSSRWFAPGIAALGVAAVSAALAAAPALAQAPAAPTAPVAPVPPSAAAPATPPAAPAPAGDVAPGKALFESSCGGCHDLSLSTDQHKSADDWRATVSRMVDNGAALTPAQAAQVTDYLAKTYGPPAG